MRAEHYRTGTPHVDKDALASIYRAYIACLNARDWPSLPRFVHDEACHNGRPFGVAGYRAMLEQDVRDIPDLRFGIDLLVCEPPRVAARLAFDCAPVGTFLGLPVNGQRVTFTENVFYEFEDGRIRHVWSLIDRHAIAAQLAES
jgi:predicted ester cyclase